MVETNTKLFEILQGQEWKHWVFIEDYNKLMKTKITIFLQGLS